MCLALSTSLEATIGKGVFAFTVSTFHHTLGTFPKHASYHSVGSDVCHQFVAEVHFRAYYDANQFPLGAICGLADTWAHWGFLAPPCDFDLADGFFCTALTCGADKCSSFESS